MAIEIIKSENINQLFEAVKLPKNYAIACEIFKKAQNGLLLFPANDIMANFALQIQTQKLLDINLLNKYCDLYNTDIDIIKLKLQKIGYQFNENTYDIPEELCKIINNEIDTGIIPYINDRIAYRGVSKSIEITNNAAMGKIAKD